MPSSTLLDLIFSTIASHPGQQITFADYMDLVLYHPLYGYYSSKQGNIGKDGDFFTSSSLGADFGQLWAEQFVQMAEILGLPQPFCFLEVGAGLGYFAKDVLHYLQQKYPHFYEIINYIIIETSPTLREKQKSRLLPFLDRVSWKRWEDLNEDSLIGCIFSNELVDAFPVHQVILNQGHLKEVYVTQKDDKLVEVIDVISSSKILEYFDLISIDLTSEAYPDGYRSEVNLRALDWLETLASKLQQGYVLTIDYGYEAQKYYHPQREQGTLQCYYQHRRHNNPYLYLGEQDITTHVNFTALEKQGKKLGLSQVVFNKQAMALMALGLGDRLQELSHGQYNLAEILQRRDALHQLIDPAGLGNFGVLVQSKGLREQPSLLIMTP